jgi:hypothetical protein
MVQAPEPTCTAVPGAEMLPGTGVMPSGSWSVTARSWAVDTLAPAALAAVSV